MLDTTKMFGRFKEIKECQGQKHLAKNQRYLAKVVPLLKAIV